MKQISTNPAAGLLLCLALCLTACRPSYEVTAVKGHRVCIDSTWDIRPDTDALALIAPYRRPLNSLRNRVVGRLDMPLTAARPESPLGQLVAEVLRKAAVPAGDPPADMGLINIGALRKDLPAGDITAMDVYEMLPFDNSICLLRLKGVYLKQLFQSIAAHGGEGISGAQLILSSDGKPTEVRINGRPIDDEQVYTLATIDYLAEGNDDMTALLQAESCSYPEGKTLRTEFSRYLEKLKNR